MNIDARIQKTVQESSRGLERWVRSEDLALLLQRTQVQLPDPRQAAHNHLKTQLQRNPMPSSGLQGHCTHMHIPTFRYTHVNIIKNKSFH